MICTFHKCYEMNYSINSWKLIIIANDIKAKEKVLKTKLKTRSRFSNDSKTGLAWRDDRTSGWQLDWSGNDFMPRLMSTPAGVVVVVLLQAGVTRCRGFRGCMMQGRGDHSYMAMGLHRQDGEHALFAFKQVLALRVFSCALSAARSTSTGTLVRPL